MFWRISPQLLHRNESPPPHSDRDLATPSRCRHAGNSSAPLPDWWWCHRIPSDRKPQAFFARYFAVWSWTRCCWFQSFLVSFGRTGSDRKSPRLYQKEASVATPPLEVVARKGGRWLVWKLVWAESGFVIGSPRRRWRAAVGEISVGWEHGPQTCSQLGQSWVYSPTRFERHDDKPLALHAGRFLACFLRKNSQERSCRFAAAIVVRSKDSRLFRTRHGRTTPSNTLISNLQRRAGQTSLGTCGGSVRLPFRRTGLIWRRTPMASVAHFLVSRSTEVEEDWNKRKRGKGEWQGTGELVTQQ